MVASATAGSARRRQACSTRLRRGGRVLVSHTGGSGGYRSYLGFDPERQVGVVLLANSATDNSRLVQLGNNLVMPQPPAR